MLLRQLTTHQHGCKAEVCFLMGVTLPLIIPKRRGHLSFGNSLFQKASGVDEEAVSVCVFRVRFTEMRGTCMLKTTLKLLQLCAL